jgi:hypothetical protein
MIHDFQCVDNFCELFSPTASAVFAATELHSKSIAITLLDAASRFKVN